MYLISKSTGAPFMPTDSVPVGVLGRKCTGSQIITALSTVTPASLSPPVGSVSAEIQADGGIVRIRRDAGAPSATNGYRLDDGMTLTIDSDLADVQLLAQSVTNVQVTYFDQV